MTAESYLFIISGSLGGRTTHHVTNNKKIRQSTSSRLGASSSFPKLVRVLCTWSRSRAIPISSSGMGNVTSKIKVGVFRSDLNL